MEMRRFTDDELLAMLGDIESDRVERKQSFSDEKKVRQAVCAFANDLPGHNQAGVLFIGAKDGGEPSGLPITDELLRKLADIKTDGRTLPLPVLTVEKRTLRGAEMAVVTVMPCDMPPVRCDGRIWVRTGPRRSVASAQEERILNEKRRHKDLPFDLRPCVRASVSDLSRTIFENEYLPTAFAPDILAENGRTYEERLAACGMVVSPDDPTPTITGLLTLGNRPRDFLPGAYIQFLRLEGTQLSDPVIVDSNDGISDGCLRETLKETEGRMTCYNARSYDVTSAPTHIIDTLYPMPALQQLLYNAVMHRAYEGTNAPVTVYWFDDRVEIHSPGGPYGNVTPENFGQTGLRDYRNPNLAGVLKTLGFVQTFGRGIGIAKNAMSRNGNPPIEFRCDQSTVCCVLRRKP